MKNQSKVSTEELLNDKTKEDKNGLIISYLTLRNLIGWCGIGLPILLWLVWHQNAVYHSFEPSISDYYYTRGGDLFVIVLSALGLFLFTYNGYELLEKILLKTAAVCAILVALVPTDPKCKEANAINTDCGLPIHDLAYRGFLGEIINKDWHLIFAALFLFCLALISIIYFTKTHDSSLLMDGNKRSQKGKRNIVYKVCGYSILGCLLFLGVSIFTGILNRKEFVGLPIIFILETLSVWAFGISWITKGETLWPDRK